MREVDIDFNKQACVFNIQRFSIHDGPGIRTIVFLKGCPLRCKWCFNPESQSPEPTRDFGEYLTVNEVYQELKKDSVTYRRSGGGVTFSGGEALMHPDFLEEVIKICKLNGWNTAIETTAFASEEVIRRIIPQLDYILLDIKAIPEQLHKEQTGVANKRILKNALIINDIAKNVVVRVPVIPNFNFSEKQIHYICQFVNHLSNVNTIHLLPYTNFGESKYKILGRDYELAGIKPLRQDDLYHLREIVEGYGFTCIIGG